MRRNHGGRLTFRLLNACLMITLAFFSYHTTGCGGDGFPEGGGIICGPEFVSNTNFEAEEAFSLEAAVGNQSTFDLLGIGGEVSITGAAGSASVVVSGIKRVRSESLEDAQAHLQDLKVELRDLGSEIGLKTSQPHCNEGRRYNVDLMITLPPHFRIQVNHVGGPITVDSIENAIAINNLSGGVVLKNIMGSAVVDLFTGEIDAEVILPLHGSIDLRTWTGDIELDIPTNTSAEFSAAVSSGTIRVLNLILHNEISTPTSRSGTLGGGQGSIYLETGQQGNIRVSGF